MVSWVNLNIACLKSKSTSLLFVAFLSLEHKNRSIQKAKLKIHWPHVWGAVWWPRCDPVTRGRCVSSAVKCAHRSLAQYTRPLMHLMPRRGSTDHHKHSPEYQFVDVRVHPFSTWNSEEPTARGFSVLNNRSKTQLSPFFLQINKKKIHESKIL